jgi:hypothetical protein
MAGTDSAAGREAADEGPARTLRLAAAIARRALVPVAAAAALGLVGAGLAIRALPDSRSDPVDTAAGWLRLPMLLATLAAVATAIEVWPAFGRGRPDAPWILRLRLGPFDGGATAAFAVAGVLALCLTVVGLTFEPLVRPGASRPVRVAVPLRAEGPPRLTRNAPHLTLRPADEAPVRGADRLEVRTLVGLSAAGEFPAARVRLLVDDRDLGVHELPPAGGLLRVELDGRPVGAARIDLEPGQDLLLWLPENGARLLGPAGVGAAANAVAAALSALPIAALALALAIAGRARLDRAVLHLGAGGASLTAWIAPWSPVPWAVEAYARDLTCWNVEAASAAAGLGAAAAGLALLGAGRCGRAGQAADISLELPRRSPSLRSR